MASPHRKAPGFTLVELIIAVTIATFVLTGATAMFIQFTKTNLSMAARSEFDRQMRVTLQTIATDTRVAANATVNGNVVTLTMASGTPTMIHYTYDASNKRLLRAEDTNADRTMLDNVTTFTASKSNNDVSYDIVFSKHVGDRDITLDRAMTFRMRN
ncbi:PulJ/GspJ family protein [Cerasicoccus arenae]|uniref:PulJ/GspJ family protein n=1 Tax=Cerasicoccus arenae TaxID=424488 RepID=UPI00167BB0FD|nr:prepilin-type N-terminal cleavage/methylation domain-containing protein [Cerasicoccus arenae]MBK1858565.1 prepilin-type N-terminal cleavage/methylation domain-containing protein [Cerasicoccus arenae]